MALSEDDPLDPYLRADLHGQRGRTRGGRQGRDRLARAADRPRLPDRIEPYRNGASLDTRRTPCVRNAPGELVERNARRRSRTRNREWDREERLARTMDAHAAWQRDRCVAGMAATAGAAARLSPAGDHRRQPRL